MEDCLSFWSTCFDTHHSLFRVRVCLHPNRRRKTLGIRPLQALLGNESTMAAFKETLARQLSVQNNIRHSNEDWCRLQSAAKISLECLKRVIESQQLLLN
ncbi:unnamed protein product [Heterobilharzia americana]|nr:unnamed protein product [Heterobilharzia americana]